MEMTLEQIADKAMTFANKAKVTLSEAVAEVAGHHSLNTEKIARVCGIVNRAQLSEVKSSGKGMQKRTVTAKPDEVAKILGLDLAAPKMSSVQAPRVEKVSSHGPRSFEAWASPQAPVFEKSSGVGHILEAEAERLGRRWPTREPIETDVPARLTMVEIYREGESALKLSSVLRDQAETDAESARAYLESALDLSVSRGELSEGAALLLAKASMPSELFVETLDGALTRWGIDPRAEFGLNPDGSPSGAPTRLKVSQPLVERIEQGGANKKHAIVVGAKKYSAARAKLAEALQVEQALQERVAHWAKHLETV